MARHLDRPWVSALRVVSTGIMVVALVTMVVSLAVLFNNEPGGPPDPTATRVTLFGENAPARESRLGRQPLAWVPVAAFGTALLAFGFRVYAERKQHQIDAAKVLLGIFPPPRPSRWERLARWLTGGQPEQPEVERTGPSTSHRRSNL